MITRRSLLRLGAGSGVGLLLGSCTTGLTTGPPPPPTTTGPPAPWAGADFAALDAYLAETSGRAFMIVEQGRLIHEWYRDADPAFRRDIASAQKSVLSLLVGHAVGEGLIALDTRIADVLGPGWTPAASSPDVTVHHLLTMTSGLDDRREVLAPPGTRWRYSNAFAALANVLVAVTGTELDPLARTWLFAPAGATTAEFRARPVDPTVAPFGLVASAADLAAIGGLVLAGGAPAVAPSWLDPSFRATQDFNLSYGFLWWLNGQPSYLLPDRPVSRPGPLIPSAPPDLVAALGRDDQKLYISRRLALVVVRLGGRADPSANASRSGFDDELWQRLMVARG